MNVETRLERPGDEAGIRMINEQAFETPAEADIVDTLRRTCPEGVSLTAVVGEEIVGHILFTPAVVVSDVQKVEGMGLAPMAVRPDLQNQGIGSLLVKAGMKLMCQAGHAYVIVLGHPRYYPRFGFELASRWHLQSEYPGVPDEAFMIHVIDAAPLAGVSGIAYYRPEFREAM